MVLGGCPIACLVPMNWKRVPEAVFLAVFIPFWLCGIIYVTVPITSTITGTWNTTMAGPYYDVISLCDNFNDTEALCAAERYLCGGISNRFSTRVMVRVTQCILLLVVQFELDVLGFLITAAFVYFVGTGFVAAVVLDLKRIGHPGGEAGSAFNRPANEPTPKHTVLLA